MPEPTFRGDPYQVLDVPPDSTDAAIKRRWRELAVEHHPDRAGGDSVESARLTRRMARINAAYDVLRDPDRRRRHDAAHPATRTRSGRQGRRAEPTAPVERDDRPSGPPPPPRTRPVTGRFDTTELFHHRNTTTSSGQRPLSGQPPRGYRPGPGSGEPRRASQPTGPVERRAARGRGTLPTLEEARDTEIEFGKFRGHTLGQVETFEPTYIDWIAKTITRDRDLVVRARVIQAELDRQGVVRRVRAPTAGFGSSRSASEGG
jgi:curved DNA-binding protein CbpA